MKRLSIIIIGDEILLGQVTDTNSGAIARAFGPEGWEVVQTVTVGDDAAAIRRAVEGALSRSDLVVTTGGLGPTRDDITRGVLMDIFGGSLRHDPAVEANIRRVFALRGLDLNLLTASQAMVPDTCTVIQNRYGTAPIMMWQPASGCALVAMPGVPYETEGMLPEVVARFTAGQPVRHQTLIVTGITESALAERLAAFEDSLPGGLHLAYLPTPGLIRLRLDGTDVDATTFDAAVDGLRRQLGTLLLHDGDATPGAILVATLARHGLTAATAESCTGGNVAHAITSVPGASAVYLGGVVSYANDVKRRLLDVGADTLEAYGAVSRQVVEQMAAGACRATGARCAMATSGIAGPGGGTPDKPVGTVWLGWCIDGRISARCVHLPGDRARVIGRATNEAITGLIKLIRDEQDNK